jgi:hypothetical protein
VEEGDVMNDTTWRSIHNTLWLRFKLREKEPALAAVLSYATGVTCPRCGGILLRFPEKVVDHA